MTTYGLAFHTNVAEEKLDDAYSTLASDDSLRTISVIVTGDNDVDVLVEVEALSANDAETQLKTALANAFVGIDLDSMSLNFAPARVLTYA
jgi:hypothetical protein